MGQKIPPGLIKRGDTWHIQKTVCGQRIRESCGTGDLKEAEKYLAFRMEEIRQVAVYGVRQKRFFREAATKFLEESTKSTLRMDAVQLTMLDPFVGDLPLESVHMGSLQGFIQHRQSQGLKSRTVNYALQVVRHILNLAASEWMDERGMTWLAHAPKIRLLRQDDQKAPYPLSPEEQVRLFKQLPFPLSKMALFKINTGCREQEVCGLRWEWEVPVPQLQSSVIIIPSALVKNRRERLVVLNRVAKGIVDEFRGQHPTHVFSYRGKPLKSMNTSGWKRARVRAGLPHVRVHDLKHTFGRRLRSMGVSFEDRQDLLGHKSDRMTTHYSVPELDNLIMAANKACSQEGTALDVFTVLRRRKTT